MMKLILSLLLVSLLKADDDFLPPVRDLQGSSYSGVCTGKTNCYAVFLDTAHVAGQIHWNEMPLYQSTASLWPSSSWAYANSQAATFLWWLMEARSKGVNNINYNRWISFYSIEKAVLSSGNGINCQPSSSSGSMRYNFHEALDLVSTSNYIFDNTDWSDKLDITKACNTTYLNSVNTTGYNPYVWTIYMAGNFTTAKNPYAGISTALSSYGLGLVSIPMDYDMCCSGATYYSDGIYNPTNTTMFYDAATVWGVWKDTNNQVWLGVYVIGAYNKSNKYLWVPLSIVSRPYTISWFQNVYLQDTSLW
uniref:Pre-progamone1 n=1 Tax=Blepharisma sp. YC-IV TaxID=1481887 RepID=A0A0E4B3V2_9CILI|nr:pre-progamone1 [Blepharisma sp. YC-IV]